MEDVAKTAVKIIRQQKKAEDALRKNPKLLREILSRLDALEDRLRKLEHPTRGRYRDEAAAEREQSVQHACDVLDEIKAGNMSFDEGKRVLRRYARTRGIAAAEARGASDPVGAEKMSRRRNKPKA